jgi:hypothetical protein
MVTLSPSDPAYETVPTFSLLRCSGTTDVAPGSSSGMPPIARVIIARVRTSAGSMVLQPSTDAGANEAVNEMKLRDLYQVTFGAVNRAEVVFPCLAAESNPVSSNQLQGGADRADVL